MKLVSEFLLMGLQMIQDWSLSSSACSCPYQVIILGNLLIILAVNTHSHLHNPVYFFFCSPTLTDICISMTIIPKVLVNIQTQDQSITSVGCLTQIDSILIFCGLENCLLDNCGLWSLYGHLSPPWDTQSSWTLVSVSFWSSHPDY
jgi:olfactory receptor